MRLVPALLVALGTLAPTGGPGAADGDRPPPDPAVIAVWIAALGSDRWEEREEATRAILELGPAAAPALRGAAGSPDPEVRSRVEWLLSVLVPPFFEVELVRFGGATPPFLPLEWLHLGVPERVGGEGETRTPGAPGRRAHVTIGEVRAPYRLELTIGSERADQEISAALELDTPTVIDREERFVAEDALGRVSIARERSFWVARLSRREGPPPARGPEEASAVATRFEEWTRSGLAAGGSRAAAALRVAALWRRLDLLPPLDAAPAGLGRETALARLAAGDEAALAPVEAIYSESLAGTDPLEPAVEEEATTLLAAAGSEAALSRLISRFEESALWAQHQWFGLLADRLAEPGFAASHGERIIAAILAPGRTAGIQWSDGLLALLFQELQDRLPPERFASALAPALPEVLDDGGGTMGPRVQLVLRILLRSLRETAAGGGPDVDRWFEPVRGLLRSGFLEPALLLLIDRRNAGQLDPERFSAACRDLGANLGVDDATLLHRSNIALERVLDIADIPAAERRRIRLDQLLCYGLSGQNANLRALVDRELVESLGPLPSPPPRPQDPLEPWLARRDQWRERLGTLPDEAFLAPVDESAPALLLTVVDLRIDETAGAVSLVDCRSVTICPGEAHPEIGADLEDRSLRIDAYPITGRPGMFRFAGGSVLEIGRPVARRIAPRWRRTEYTVSPKRLGFGLADRPQQVVFESLILLEEPPTGSDTPEELRPAPGDPPAELRRKLEGRLIAALAKSSEPLRRDFLTVIARFRIEAAAAPLAEAYDANPDIDLARALLALGDRRGRDLLLAAARPGERDAIDILGALLRSGDPAALEPTLRWIEAPSQAPGSIHSLIQSLDAALQDPRLAPHIEESRLLGALIAAIDQEQLVGLVMPLLRRRTGLDHGYLDTFQIFDAEERQAAIAESLERWREWWRARSAGGE